MTKAQKRLEQIRRAGERHQQMLAFGFDPKRPDRGSRHERTESDALEKAFADRWEKENGERPAINRGHGLLQDLFIESNGLWITSSLALTDGERFVAATAIQWLGTNCGFSFLRSCLKDAGYEVVEVETLRAREEKRRAMEEKERLDAESRPGLRRFDLIPATTE